MTTAERQTTIKTNAEACERILRRMDRRGTDLERLRVDTLYDTPFDALEALVWAYREIERLEAERA
jgi:acetolactate synthase regulatory subunit